MGDAQVMTFPVNAPRINNNDDFVTVVGLNATEGGYVRSGQTIASVETEKSIVEVSAERDGYVLKLLCQVGQQIAVGSVMMWLGATPDEEVPRACAHQSVAASTLCPNVEPTAKARALLEEHGLDPNIISFAGSRLGVSDVEAYLARTESIASLDSHFQYAAVRPGAEGHYEPMSAEGHGMQRTVTWHRDEAVPAYLEIPFDHSAWERYAADYAQSSRLLLSPLLPLLTYRLVEIARETRNLNSTLVDGRKFVYRHVNVGFTVQAGTRLYLVVVKHADRMSVDEFIEALGELQVSAIGRRLAPENAQGATVAFTSMARWNVSRHTPILPPYTSIIVAHSAPRTGDSSSDPTKAVLGASYDHRVLTGYDVVEVLRSLSKPPKA